MDRILLHNLSKLKNDKKLNGSLPHLAFKAMKEEISSDETPRSAPSSRSNSFRNKIRHKNVKVENDSSRRHSMPHDTQTTISVSYNDLSKEQLQRVRSFKITSKGLVNKGDNFRRESNASILSTGSIKLDDIKPRKQRLQSSNSDDSGDVGSCASSLPGNYQVTVTGASDVGKTSLIKQFMTSEYVGILDVEDADEMQTVSVHLDGEESTLEFVDVDNIEKENECNLYADAHLVVFAINSKATFDIAAENMKYIRETVGSDRPIILVANKVDLVRKRQVSAKEAKYIAEKYHSKYAETSVTLNHRVDDVLAGLLKQIHLKLNVDSQSSNENRRSSITIKPKSFFYRFFKSDSIVKNCDNLYIT
ncbi:hypothetical protein KUTeg_000945 [Tegillarca granosa]|uniref:Uncharacterized protein n=1 Tax=Tegillarca granosa TaxID=220873 RepID=A0ABQ9FZ21_TEGGR|nr:hypothetical protein KUTeg_000945 [Tegillarca granosa]